MPASWCGESASDPIGEAQCVHTVCQHTVCQQPVCQSCSQNCKPESCLVWGGKKGIQSTPGSTVGRAAFCAGRLETVISSQKIWKKRFCELESKWLGLEGEERQRPKLSLSEFACLEGWVGQSHSEPRRGTGCKLGGGGAERHAKTAGLIGNLFVINRPLCPLKGTEQLQPQAPNRLFFREIERDFRPGLNGSETVLLNMYFSPSPTSGTCEFMRHAHAQADPRPSESPRTGPSSHVSASPLGDSRDTEAAGSGARASE